MLRPGGLASPAPARAFTFELSPPESPQTDVEYHYAGKQPIPATGLAPVRQAALWAASQGRQEKDRRSRPRTHLSVPCGEFLWMVPNHALQAVPAEDHVPVNNQPQRQAT